jgi:YD repeat-containing protein
LTAETLTLNGRTYGMSYAYNSLGQLTSRTLPSGRNLTFANDGLGRAKTVSSGGILQVAAEL